LLEDPIDDTKPEWLGCVSTDLRNWLGFLSLRMAPGTQFEIRMYANAVGELIKEAFPRTWELFKV